jgi:hypothetical protein
LATESEHVAAAHALEAQTPLAQSLARAQAAPAPQGLQLPPQSTAVSLPFLIPSVQLGCAQENAEQTPLAQSPPMMHVLAPSQAGQPPPPQSMSVSLPFRLPSTQVGSTHTPALQMPVAQSPGALQVWAAGHALQLGPPQSVPVSPPLRTPSVHVGSWHLAVVHT